jgi:CheY-like chemotaxis protein
MLGLCRELRADPKVRACTAILVTAAGRVTRPQVLAVLRAGGNGVWGEPLDSEEFLLRLDGYVRAKLDADQGPRA